MTFAGVISCEHASNAVPPELGDLGVDPSVLDSHVAWDPGAKVIAQRIAERFGHPLHLGRWTRLVADLNRRPSNPESVPVHAFGVDVPANAALDEAGLADRRARYHTPYWDAVLAEVQSRLQTSQVLHVSVHSFTPVYQGVTRAVDVGLLVDPGHPLEARFTPALQRFIADRGFDVRVNEPYDGRTDAMTTYLRTHFPVDRLAAVEFEVSQRLVDDPAQLDAVGATIVDALAALQVW